MCTIESKGCEADGICICGLVAAAERENSEEEEVRGTSIKNLTEWRLCITITYCISCCVYQRFGVYEWTNTIHNNHRPPHQESSTHTHRAEVDGRMSKTASV